MQALGQAQERKGGADELNADASKEREKERFMEDLGATYGLC